MSLHHLPVFDQSGCFSFLIDDSRVKKILPVFIEETDKNFELLTQAVKKKAEKEIIYLLDKMQEGSAYCGVKRLEEALKSAVVSARRKSFLPLVLNNLQKEIDLAKNEITHFLKSS